MKSTAIDFKDKISFCLPIQDKKSKKKGLKRLHTKAVGNSINQYENNRVLGSRPPEINKKENKLCCRARTKLAQLRSGFSRSVNDYMSRIRDDVPNNCPNCNATPHDVNHLINCPTNPTLLKPIDLWKRPLKVVDFLKLDGT